MLPIKQIDMTKLFLCSDTGHTCDSQRITDFFSLIYLLSIYDFCPYSFFFQFFYLLFHSFQLCYVFVLLLQLLNLTQHRRKCLLKQNKQQHNINTVMLEVTCIHFKPKLNICLKYSSPSRYDNDLAIIITINFYRISLSETSCGWWSLDYIIINQECCRGTGENRTLELKLSDIHVIWGFASYFCKMLSHFYHAPSGNELLLCAGTCSLVRKKLFCIECSLSIVIQGRQGRLPKRRKLVLHLHIN